MRRPLALLALTLSCGGVDPAGSNATSITTASTGTTTIDHPSVATVTSATAHPSDESNTDASSTNPTTEGTGTEGWSLPPGCGQLDVVFVVERSFTTSPRMFADAASIFAGLEKAVPGWSVHVMAVEGRVGTIPGFCEDACAQDGTCDEAWEPVSCDALHACDWTRGAGMVWDGPAQRCVAGERRWLDLADPLALDQFRCLWSGATGAGEIDTITSLLEATSSALTQTPDGCNEGFLRSDAFLVPVLVSHGYPTAPGSPASWADELAQTKTGERELIIGYESEGDALPFEHEREHRELVEALLGRPLDDLPEGASVVREEVATPPDAEVEREEPGKAKQAVSEKG
ncbi:MAG: hypothetical protein KC468_31265 [Myxococcales bacterium]|nr:hypothetical protein [Myxococcales bacterium]